MNDTINNESNVNDPDNGVTTDRTGERTDHLVGKVWSIGLAREVEVIGHSTDPNEDVWLVARDEDGDSSPDNAIRRAGSDLLPNFVEGMVLTVPGVRVDGGWGSPMTVIVATRSARGLYFHTKDSLGGLVAGNFAGGATHREWAWMRERFNENLVGILTGSDAEMLGLLWSLATQRAKALAETREVRARQEQQHEAFKRQVALVASRYGREHDMCHVLDEALSELGLERIRPRFEVTVQVTQTYRVNADDEDAARERVLHFIDGITTSGDDSHEDFEEWGTFEKDDTDVTDVTADE